MLIISLPQTFSSSRLCWHQVRPAHNWHTGLYKVSISTDISLIPRPFEGRRKGLVHTVCACTKFTEHFLVQLARYHHHHLVGQRILSTWSLYLSQTTWWSLQTRYFKRLLYSRVYLLTSHFKQAFLVFKDMTKCLRCRWATACVDNSHFSSKIFH